MQAKERPILFSKPMVRAIIDGSKTMTRRIINFDRLRVIPRFDLKSDFPFPLHKTVKVTAGKKYPCAMNPHGAVCAVLPNGEYLGLKPGEFDFCCPYASGKTILATENGKQSWRIFPHDTNRLWVRETFYIDHCDFLEKLPKEKPEENIDIYYRADGECCDQIPECCCHEYPWKTPWKPSIHMPRWASRILLEVTEIRVERLQEITEDEAKAEGVITEKAVKVSSYVYWFENLWENIHGPGSWDANPWVWVVCFKVVEVKS